jgi:large subunit ribosomal protein L25
VIDLGIDNAAPIRVLVRETQTHPYRAEVLHVDFYQVFAGEKVNVELPIRVTGTAVGVREGGILDQMLHELPVRCDVDKIPDSIEIDVSDLAIGDTIHVRDLTIPAGVEVEVEEDRVVCSVTPPTVAALEEEGEPEVEEGVTPELIGQEEPSEE